MIQHCSVYMSVHVECRCSNLIYHNGHLRSTPYCLLQGLIGNMFCLYLQGVHLQNFWYPDQQQPFGQQPAGGAQQQQQQWPTHAAYHQTQPARQQGRSQQIPPAAALHQQPHHTHTALQLLTKQIAFKQACLEKMPEGPQADALMTEIDGMLNRLLMLQESFATAQQHNQEQQRQQQTYSHQGQGFAAIAANYSWMMGSDPLEAMMQPGINSNQALRAAVGTRLGMKPAPDMAAAAMGWIQHTVLDFLQRQGASCKASSGADVAACGAEAATEQPVNPESGPQAAAPVVREVPYMKDFQSLLDLMNWYTQVRDLGVVCMSQIVRYYAVTYVTSQYMIILR